MKYPIDRKERITLGGMTQAIHIWGTKPENPVVLFLHGGPGVPNRHGMSKNHMDLLDDFTIVAWDQRGTGGSYFGCDPATLTLEQLIGDCAELIEYLCRTLQKKKIFLLGGSWGTELGTLVCQRYGELVVGYIGYGQVVNGIENENVSYAYTLEKAKEAGCAEDIAKLEEIGPPVDGQYQPVFEGLMAQRSLLKKLAFDNWDDMYAAIGYGGLTALKAVGRIQDDIKRLLKGPIIPEADRINPGLRITPDSEAVRRNRHAINGVIVEDIDSCMIKFAKCCTPVPGDAIAGFITKGFGVSVHRADCPNAAHRTDPRQAARWVRVRWANQEEQPFETTLELDCITRDGLLLDVAMVMTTARVRVKELTGKDLPGGKSMFLVRFEVKNYEELEAIRNKLMNIRDVVGSRRGQN